jgi:catabolite regulation protein CreA
MSRFIAAAACALALASPAHADSIGEVDTVFKLIGPDTRS